MILPTTGEKVGQRQTIPIPNKARSGPLSGLCRFEMYNTPS